MFKKTKKGFTIVELVIVIAVIGILSAILIPTFANLTNQANDTALRSNLASAYSMYASEAADHEIKSVSSSVEVKVADIEFVGQDKVFLVKSDETDKDQGYRYLDNSWNVTKVAFATAFDGKTKTLVSTNETLSTFGGYIVYYAK